MVKVILNTQFTQALTLGLTRDWAVVKSLFLEYKRKNRFKKKNESVLGSASVFPLRILPLGAPRLHALINYFEIDICFDCEYTYTYTLNGFRN